MESTTLTRFIKRRLWPRTFVLSVLLPLCIAPTTANGKIFNDSQGGTQGEIRHTLEITEIKLGRKTVESAEKVSVHRPGELTKVQAVKKGDIFETGTQIGTPDKTSLWLKSEHGNVIKLFPNSQLQMATNPKGESYTISKGIVSFNVAKLLDFFEVQPTGGKIQAAVKNTAFMVELVDKKLKFVMEKGMVEVQHKVPVTIKGKTESGGGEAHKEGGRDRELTTVTTEKLTIHSGDGTFELDNSAAPEYEFDSYNDALEHFEEQKVSKAGEDDFLSIADHHSTLGYLHLEHGSPKKALAEFQQALKIHEKFLGHEVNPMLVEDLTNLGHAYQDLGNADKAFEYFEAAGEMMTEIDPADPHIAEIILDIVEVVPHMSHLPEGLEELENLIEIVDFAIEILEHDIELNKRTLVGAQESDDNGLVWITASALADDYKDLAWAWSLKKDEAQSQKYLNRSKQYIQLLSD